MTAPTPPAFPPEFRAVLDALIAACDAAEQDVRDSADMVDAYAKATALRSLISERETWPARQRALAAAQIKAERGLSIAELGELLGLSKSRTDDLLRLRSIGGGPAADPDPPGYLTFAASLRDRIASGDLPAGSLLSVADLMSEHGMTRGVVLRAVAILKDEGLVTTSGGRGGGVRVL